MNREEQIISEAKKHYYDDINCHNAFLHGVEWADEHPANVWHEPSEIPEEGQRILVHFNKYYGDAHTFLGFDADDWRDWCKKYNVSGWAVIGDLLPKGGKQ